MTRMQKFLVLALLLVFNHETNAQFKKTVTRQHQLLARLLQNEVVEGFDAKISGTDITYTSVRDDCGEALIARATDGTMDISWKSAPLPAGQSGEQVTYFMAAGFGHSDQSRKFDFFINGEKRFTYTTDLKGDWTLPGGSGGEMAFTSFLVDGNRDHFGYLTITIPRAWIKPGAPAVFRVEGEHAGDYVWLMIFKCPDAWSFFKNKAAGEMWMDVTVTAQGRNARMTLTAPGFLEGKAVEIKTGDKEGKTVLRRKGGTATGEFKIKEPADQIPGKPVLLMITGSNVTGYPEWKEKGKAAVISGDFLTTMTWTTKEGERTLYMEYAYKPVLSGNLRDLSESVLKNGEIHLINSSHQDIAWMDSPQQCIIDRDKLLVTPALRQIKEHPDYCHDLEDVLILREYLGRHPDRKEEIYRYSRAGNITWGASYNMPYEDMYAGESLVREFYLGKKWLEREFPGVVSLAYWNPDVPGRTLQMPQILAKSGVKYMIISRHRRGVFHWESPDGSSVVTYSSKHYAMSYSFLQRGFSTAAELVSGLAKEWKGYNTDPSAVAVMPVMSSTDMSPPAMYYELINEWNGLTRVNEKDGREEGLELPVMMHSTAGRFLNKMVLSTPNMETVRGERPDVWVYIHGPSHQRALSAGREAGIWLPAAEKFATVRALLENDPALYPREDFTNAWEAAIYPDHGWGGKNGNITDTVFLRKMILGKNIARKILKESLSEIAGKIKTNGKKGMPLIVFNSLSWTRTGPVSARLDFKKGMLKGFVLRDAAGERKDFQVTALSSWPDGSLRTADVVFIAERVPSIGYVTYYVEPGRSPVTAARKDQRPAPEIENPFYDVILGHGGIQRLYDKTLGEEIFSSGGFEGAEWFTMHSFGNGAGEFADIQQPDMEGFDKMTNHRPQWKMVEDGPVRTVVAFEQDVEHMKVTFRLAVYKTVKRLDMEVDLLNWDGTPYREFRLAFPINMKQGMVSYEVPFGVVRVGRDELNGSAGERYVTPCKDVHPRGIMNWIGADNDHFGVTLSSSVAVADYVDPSGRASAGPVLQPILLASRHSCHWEGLQFSQEGDHHYRFSLTSHKPGWINGYRFGMESNEPMQVVFNPLKKEPQLPESRSFFSVEGGEVVISTVKFCEDDDHVIIRFYENGGKDVRVRMVPGFEFSGARKTNLLEREEGELKMDPSGLEFPLGHHAIETIKLIR